jgi:hypothetical protein
MDGNSLTQVDIETFKRLKISLELLSSAGIERVTDREAREYGVVGSGDMAGLLFPYFDTKTSHRWTARARVRRDHPEIEDGKPRRKYVAAFGDKKHLYFSSGAGELLADCNISVIFVEAEKSVLAGMAWAQRTNRRVLFIGTGGCWGWRGRTGVGDNAKGERVNETGPLTDFNLIAWQNRDVVILFDSNATTNFNVRRARFALARELIKRGAKVRLGDLPVIDRVNGSDDLIAECGDWSIATLLEMAGTLADVALAEAEAVVTELTSSAEAREQGDLKHIFAALAAISDREARERLIGRAAKAFGRLLSKDTIRGAVENLRQERSRDLPAKPAEN